jgi:hypothetical protein
MIFEIGGGKRNIRGKKELGPPNQSQVELKSKRGKEQREQ